jgi:hypothetical protein
VKIVKLSANTCFITMNAIFVLKISNDRRPASLQSGLKYSRRETWIYQYPHGSFVRRDEYIRIVSRHDDLTDVGIRFELPAMAQT